MAISGMISGQTFNLKALFERATYRIDYYQREYAWSADDVRTLVADLFEQFETAQPSGRPSRRDAPVEPFFLGPFVYSEEHRGTRFLVDGQQRFTTLHLIFIHLRHLAVGYRQQDAVDKLNRVILDFVAGSRQFRVDIDERRPALTALYEPRRYELPSNASLSLRNLWARGEQIAELLETKLTSDNCSRFIDWLLNHVVLVGIQARNRDSGYRIFESMNDRGARLSPVDLVKSFLLSHVGRSEEELNKSWRSMLAEVTTIRDDADAPKKFLKAVLIGRYAELNTPGDRDAQEIDTALNVWVRKNHECRLNLRQPDDYFRLVGHLIELSKHYVTFLRATRNLHADHGLAALFYNDVNGINNQMDLILAAVRPQDVPSEAKAKAALVANYLDRLLVIRALNEEPIEASDFEPEIRRLIPLLRPCTTVADVAKVLAAEASDDAFESVLTFGLRGNNRAQVRYILARLTAYTEIGCGRPDQSEAYLDPSRAWQIEHLWPNHPERYQAQVPDAVAFRLLRSRIGGLGLLHFKDNASLGDLPFADKMNVYARQPNLLAILVAGHRKNNTFIRDFVRQNSIESCFRDFGPGADVRTVVEGRAELFRRLCLRIWDPQNLGLPVQWKTTESGEDKKSMEAGGQAKGAQGDKTARRLNTDVAKMVRTGTILPGAKIVLAHQGVDHFATIGGDGMICFPSGDSFSKLDEAGKIITQRRCDGLGEWHVIIASGARMSLRELRDRAKVSR